ncbi:MAG: VOC family protein [Maribacter sp.]|uniref:VOC family protein n=1 Tax=Maribacter sp. TaxID=1897614 RepID=UPI00329A755C
MKKQLRFQWITMIFLSIFLGSSMYAQTDPKATLKDSPTTIIGFNHIGISVFDLDKMVAFYEKATDFEIVKREKVQQHAAVDILFGRSDVAYERVTFKAPNMLLELTEYVGQQNTKLTKMLPQGPGMTHTCYQSPSWKSGYDKFKNAKINLLSRGDEAVDLGGYGVTYAYGHDPEGNMLELEQMEAHFMKQAGMDSLWLQQNDMWMTQVAIMSPDIQKISDFYRGVLGFSPNRKAKLEGMERLDDIAGQDGVVLHATWYKMDGFGKMLELMQYEHPKTSDKRSKKDPTALGYTFSLEVSDIQQEYERMKNMGVAFLSEPQLIGEFYEVFAHDVDGNVFSLRQVVSKASAYSMQNFDY